MDLNGAGVTTVAEWFNFRVEHIIAKAATFTTHSTFVQKNEDNDGIDKDDLVYRNSFSKLVDMVASISRTYGCLPIDVELYKTKYGKGQARRRMFDSVDMGGTGVVYTDEWLNFRMEHFIAEATTLAAHLILDYGNDEEFKAFANAVEQNDTNPFLNTGTMEEFKAFADADNFRQRLLPQRGGCQGLPPQHGDHKVLNLIDINKYSVPDDVSPHMAPAGNDGRVRGSLYAQADIPRPEGERGRTSGSLPSEADVPRPEEERGRNDDPLRVAEMGSPCHSSGCQKIRSKGLEEMSGEKEKRENSHATM